MTKNGPQIDRDMDLYEFRFMVLRSQVDQVTDHIFAALRSLNTARGSELTMARAYVDFVLRTALSETGPWPGSPETQRQHLEQFFNWFVRFATECIELADSLRHERAQKARPGVRLVFFFDHLDTIELLYRVCCLAGGTYGLSKDMLVDRDKALTAALHDVWFARAERILQIRGQFNV